MVPRYEFPEELLEGSVEKRCQFFKSQLITHKLFQTALTDLLLEIDVAEPNTVIFLIGPPGVGKSMLFRVLKDEILKRNAEAMHDNPGMVPVAGVEAIEGESERFSWRQYRYRLLLEIDPVGINRKLPMSIENWQKTHKSPFPVASSLGGGDLQYALEIAIKNRKVQVILVDEADAIAKASSGRRQLSQLEVTKSQANLTEVPHVMFGTYDLWKYRSGISNHLNRRTVEVHFGRYRTDRKQDYEEFLRTVRKLRRLLPLPEPPDLDPSMDFLYARTIGCIGSLKILLNKSLKHVLRAGGTTITQRELERHALPAKKCNSLIVEAARYEAEMEDSDEDRATLNEKLGLKQQPSPKPQPAAQRSGNAKPGVRNPTRDPIGLSHEQQNGGTE